MQRRPRIGCTIVIAILAWGAIIVPPVALAKESCLEIVERSQPSSMTRRDSLAPKILSSRAEAMSGTIVGAMAGLVATPGTASPSGVPVWAPPPLERDRFSSFSLNGVVHTTDQPISTFSSDVDSASMGVVRRFLNDGDLPPTDAVRVEELVNYFDYDYPRPARLDEPFAPSVNIMPSPWGQGRDLMVVGIRGWSPASSRRPPANIVLLADVSGSMRGSDRLGLVSRSMALLVDQLGASDHVALVTYAGSDRVVLKPTSADDKETVCTALANLSSGGGTAGSKGIRTAYKLAEEHFQEGAINRIILATDGDFNLGIVDDGRLEDFVARKRKSGIYLSILGVGRGNYNDQTMQKLAQAGNGMAAYLDSLDEGRRVLVEKLAAQLRPIADDVKFQIEFNPSRVAEYRLVGYETRLLQQEDFANDTVDAGDVGDGHTVTAIYEIAAPGSAGLRLPKRRYGRIHSVAPNAGADSEVAFLRLRWKAPGKTTSKLMERPVTDADRGPLAQQSDDVRFAVAVAGFGQILQQNKALTDFELADAMKLARSAIGSDPNGHRTRFVSLMKTASTLR